MCSKAAGIHRITIKHECALPTLYTVGDLIPLLQRDQYSPAQCLVSLSSMAAHCNGCPCIKLDKDDVPGPNPKPNPNQAR